MIYSFQEWLEAVRTQTQFGDDPGTANPPERDPIGIPALGGLGFRKSDVFLINKESKQVEKWLDESTSHLGVHWLVLYLAPQGLPETPPAQSVNKMKQAAKPYWQQYTQQAKQAGAEALQSFSKEEALPPPSPNNTIVYVKPTSRVHSLNSWQQIHNIGHAVWGANKSHLAQFAKELRETIYKLQQVHHDPQGNKPSWAEMVVFMSRLLDLKSFQRIYQLQSGDLDNPKTRVNTALNSFMESMFELVAAYIRNKGKIPFRPREEVVPANKAQMATPNRIGNVEPNPEVTRKFGVRNWAWQAMPENSIEAWKIARDDLTQIVEQAIVNCVYSQVGPIYATQGYLTTKP